MELQQIVDRYAEGLPHVDATTTTQGRNNRTRVLYPLSLHALNETQAVEELSAWWARAHPQDFAPAPDFQRIDFPYPHLAGARCDHVFTSDGRDGDPEWAIEVKRPQLIGDNGKRNDYAVGKMISPFLKDRSLLHDVVRLRASPVARRQAVIGYAFRYDLETCAEALRRHPDAGEAIGNIVRVCNGNGGEVSPEPLINMCDGMLRLRNLTTHPPARQGFEAWRHPCGGIGVVFGWEISPPGTPQHPW